MRRATIIVLHTALAGLLASSVATAQRMDFRGENIGWDELIPGSFNVPGIPLLDHFDLSYVQDDHHVQAISLYPPTEGQIGLVSLRDDGLSRFRYDVGWRLLIPQTVMPEISLESGECDRRRCTVQLDDHPGSDGGIFVLVGFGLQFTNWDKHIDVIQVREHNQELIVEFADKNGDDPFRWNVEFTYLPASLVHTTKTVWDTAEGWDSASTGLGSDVVIAGFRFDFEKKDHHIKDFAIDVRDGDTVSVKFNDKNGDDDYTWIVDLVELE